MPIHSPRRISSSRGLGLNTVKKLDFVSDTLAYGTETWEDLEKPWHEGDIVIADKGYVWRTRWEVGKPYIINKFLNDQGKLVGVYCDICRPVEKTEDGFAFIDLYLDVWQVAGGKPVILDQDELTEAVNTGYVSPEEADEVRAEAKKVIELLTSHPEILKF